MTFKSYKLVFILLFSYLTSFSQECGFDSQINQLRQNPNYLEQLRKSEEKIQTFRWKFFQNSKTCHTIRQFNLYNEIVANVMLATILFFKLKLQSYFREYRNVIVMNI